jgi:MFS family permease
MAVSNEIKRSGRLRGHRDFRFLWFGDTISQFGTQVSALAIPLVAVLYLHSSPVVVGVLFALEFTPFLVVGLPAGVWCDRWRRRPVMINSDLARFVLLASVTVSAWLRALTIWQVFAVVLLQGVATTFFDVAYQSYLPSLVGSDQLMEANAKLQGSAAVAQLSGPTAAGFLIQWLTAPVAVVFDAASYLISAVSVGALRHSEPGSVRIEGQSVRREMAEGLRYVAHHPLLRSLTMATAVLNFFMAMFSAIILVFLARNLHLSPGAIGLLMSAGSVGGIIGAVSVSALGQRLGTIRAAWLPLALGCTLGLLVPLARPGAGLAFFVAGWLGFSFAFTAYNVAGVTLRQQLCPKELLGRMNATVRVLCVGPMPLGALLGGVLNGSLGAHTSLWVTQVGALAVPAILLLSPLRTTRDLPARAASANSDV